MKKVISLLEREVIKAIAEGEVPVACVITKDEKIIAHNHNKKIQLNNPLAHAEILCIKQASNKLKTWNLNDCTMYVSLKPCKMCVDVIEESRIKTVIYITDNNKNISSTLNIVSYTKYLKSHDEFPFFQDKLISFFKDKR